MALLIPRLGRTGLAAASLLIAGMWGGTGALAQSPARTTASMIVPYPAGSAFDMVARRIQSELGTRLGRTVIVENFGGASGSLGAQRLLNADAEMLTMLVASPNELTLPPLAMKSVRYKPDDFRMVAQLQTGVLAVIARPDYPVNSLKELVDKAKQPGARPLSFGSTGTGSLFHMVGIDFGRRLNIPVTHVPYKGGAPAMQDVMAGQIDVIFLPLIPSYIQAAKAGRIKVLGVLSADRHAGMPNVPSVDDIPALRGFHYAMWTGLFVSSKLPKATAEAVSKAANHIIDEPTFRDWVAEQGNSVGAVMDLEQSASYFGQESSRFARLASDIKLERE
ncbi:Bug family tripartite tricarboxylate transporter substrate binding protein [Cupriavidus basilensis]|uniref:Bug family tripartite tricarboxylate transporter substrate binding protein n=1 Tax=Cupriavidus basilensis TaxID=68895 RepID=UPI00157A25EF|nr:tripartite tricarboxylate transporter substrate binding protein [Cupriavidus basilensis]NUA30612.1 tripartite tricarboxylate transporter substrate binding protein [Cupriavidus basilensis]